MKREDISNALSGIDPAYIEEAAEDPAPRLLSIRTALRYLLPAAACLVLVVSAALVLPGEDRTEEPTLSQTETAPMPPAPDPAPAPGLVGALPPQMVPTPPPLTAESPRPPVTELSPQDTAPPEPPELPEAVPEALPEDGNDVCLPDGSAVPMSWEDLLDYFGVTLPVPEVLPQLRPLPVEEPTLFAAPDGAILRDTTPFVFASPDGAERLTLTLSRAVIPESPRLDHSGPLPFTTVNGRDLALFSLPEGLRAEWYQDGTGWVLTAQGLSRPEVLRVLEALVEPAAPAEVHSLTGALSAIDPYARHIALHPESGPTLGFDLPEDFDFAALSLFDTLTITWKGEPASLLHVWEEQVLTLSP